MTIEDLKNVFYITGSILGIVGFIRTLKKRDSSELNYKTEFGDEVKPFLLCIRGDMFNLEISNKDESVIAKKLPFDTILSQVKYRKIDENSIECSSYFPILKEGEILWIPNDDLNMPKVYIEYEDKYRNKYRQTFEFDFTDNTKENHLHNQSRSFYKISKRYWRLLWIWSSPKAYNWKK